MYSLINVSEVRVRSSKETLIVQKPQSVRMAEVLLSNGSVVNVTLVNTHNAKVLKMKPIKLPAEPDVPLTKGNTTIVEAKNMQEQLDGKVEIIPMEGGLIDPGLGKIVMYSSQEEHDGELWFVISPNDPDGIPFWREVELNKELDASGFSERFDPSDGYIIGYYDPGLWVKLNRWDKLGDYDGEGVPNAVELFIGKDPAKRDILGIELNISVEWRMSEEDKKNLIYSIRKASDFIYDYTDGYAMITKVTIWDDKRNWDKADIWVNKTFLEVKFWGDNKKWPHATVGGYWIGGKLVMPFRFLRLTPPMGIAEIGGIKWAKALGHELGHYVFWFGDEYMDWNGKSYFWNYGLDGPNVDEHAPHSVMHHEWKWSELSTPKDYERFHEYLSEKFGDWKNYATNQWLGDMSNLKDRQSWNHSAWETLYILLTGTNEPAWLSKVDFKRQRPQINTDFGITGDFIPKTGPYTGVGYFMEVSWE